MSDARPRVALLCDYAEERWLSMDYCAQMLHAQFESVFEQAFNVTLLRPPFRARFSKIPGCPGGAAWNGDRLANRFYDYPRWLKSHQENFDLFHIIDHSYSQLALTLPRGRVVVTCHDLDAFRSLLEPAADPRPLWFRTLYRRVLDGLQRAAHVVAVSEQTRKEILKHRLIPEDRISVIHNGVDPVYRSDPDPSADEDAATLLRLRELPGPRILSVSSNIPRKRLDTLLRSVAALRVRMPEVVLVRAGGTFTREQEALARELGLSEHIIGMPFLERRVLAAVYRKSAALLQTSSSEGFGLPVVEAMACGCPVIASDIAVFREVGGACARYCPVGDFSSFATAAENLLRGVAGADEASRAELIEHASAYSWTVAARATAGIYRRVLGIGGEQ